MRKGWYSHVGSGASAIPDNHTGNCNRRGEPLSNGSERADYYCRYTRMSRNCSLPTHFQDLPDLCELADWYEEQATGWHHDSQDRRPEVWYFLPERSRWCILRHHK